MIRKIKKTILILLISFSSFIFLGGPEHGGGNSGSFGGEGNECYIIDGGWDNRYQHNSDIIIEMKDMYGNKIEGSIFDSKISKEFLAGTYVMLKIKEVESFNSTSKCNISVKKTVYTCAHYENESYTVCVNASCSVTETGTRRVLKSVYSRDCSCGGDEVIGKRLEDISGSYIGMCTQKIRLENFDLEAMYKAQYRDSNDIDGTNHEQIMGNKCSKPEKKENDDLKTGTGYSYNGSLKGECTISYDRESDICIDVRNGKVRYLDGQTNGKCKENEYKVTKDQDGYWKYFIPLNANSADDFSFRLETSGAKEDPRMCQAYKDYYPDSWDKIIKDDMGQEGCTFEIDVTIPVIQRFYNELREDTETVFEGFKGFNFYYKPIDIDNPFPNGLNNVSIWYDWKQSNSLEPDISESYDKLTYYANTSQNENEIRKYNNQKEYDNDKKDYPYASWEGKNENDTEGGMNKDGTSNFIDNKDIVIRRTKDFYNLGCGPKNTNVNNIFTQPECDR